MSRLTLHSPVFASLFVAITIGFCCLVFTARAEPRVVNYGEIPSRFEQYQDEKGFLWQVNKEGSLCSGETQYLPSGLKVFLNGKAFKPAKGQLSDSSETGGPIDLILVGDKVDNLLVRRNYWFDTERGGVRSFDTIENSSNKSIEIKVEYKTAFQFPWQNLIGTSGKILGSEARVDLNERDQGLAVKFAVADGRQDTVLLVRGGKGGNSPEISASSNSRELVLTYNLTIPSGQSRALVHWMIRRNLSKLDEIEPISNVFYTRRQLVNARIPSSMTKSIHNFDGSAFPQLSGAPANLGNLVALNELLDRVGVLRKSEDTLRVSANNQLVGKVDSTAVVKLADGKEISISKVAAIEGGAGIGRNPRVFLRNGTVVTGDLELDNFSFQVGDTWAVKNGGISELDLLLLGLSSNDGVIPSKTQAFIELRSGEVVSLASISGELKMVSVWGVQSVAIDKIAALQYVSQPRPEYRLNLIDGTSLGSIPAQPELSVVDTSGASRSIATRSIRRIWKVGNALIQAQLYEQRWLELADVPKEQMPPTGFLLQGNNLYSGNFAENQSISLIDEGAVFDISPTQIISMGRIDDSEHSSLPQFEIELTNGDRVKGGIRQGSLELGTGWTVPTRHIIAFRSKEGGSR